MTVASIPYKLLPQWQKPIYDAMRVEYADLYGRLEKAGFLLDFGADDSDVFMKFLRRGSGYYLDVGASELGKVWGMGSETPKDPGPWEGELRNMWKPTQVENLWINGGNLHQCRHYSLYLALQLKARLAGLDKPVYGLAPSFHQS